MRGQYILGEDRKPIPCDDHLAWSVWMFGEGGDERRRVALDKLADHTVISTVFIGIDLNDTDCPHVFETLSDCPYSTERQMRWSTWEEALAGHEKEVQRLRTVLWAVAAGFV